MASHSQSTCVAQRSRVRSSSSWRCGSRRWQKVSSCNVCACSPARDSQVVTVACRKPKTRSAADGSNPSASAVSTIATCWEGVFKRYNGVSCRALNVVWQAWQRNVWIRSTRPCLPSPTKAWTRTSMMLKYRHFWFGQAKPSVSIRLGAPRRLFTSHQGRSGSDTVPPPNEGREPRRQAGQSSGVRGFSRRWSELCLALLRGEEGRRWSWSRHQSSASARRRQTTSKNTNR